MDLNIQRKNIESNEEFSTILKSSAMIVFIVGLLGILTLVDFAFFAASENTLNIVTFWHEPHSILRFFYIVGGMIIIFTLLVIFFSKLRKDILSIKNKTFLKQWPSVSGTFVLLIIILSIIVLPNIKIQYLKPFYNVTAVGKETIIIDKGKKAENIVTKNFDTLDKASVGQKLYSYDGTEYTATKVKKGYKKYNKHLFDLKVLLPKGGDSSGD